MVCDVEYERGDMSSPMITDNGNCAYITGTDVFAVGGESSVRYCDGEGTLGRTRG